jgi:uncharacterized membrane protein
MAKKNNLKQQREKKIRNFIEKFINDFEKINGRDPIESEIIDNLKDQIDIAQIKDVSIKIFNEKQTDDIVTKKPANLTNKNALSIDISELPI